MMKLTMCALALLSLSSCYAQDKPKGTFALARNGKAVATIILARNPTRSAEFAAGELQDHVRNITSATLPIVREPDANQTAVVKGARILVGESAATRNLGLKSADFKPQEYLIQSTRDTLILMGNDEMAASDAESAGISEPGRAPGKFGLAASFNGKNTLLSTPDSHFSDETGSLSGWVQLLDKASDVDGTILSPGRRRCCMDVSNRSARRSDFNHFLSHLRRGQNIARSDFFAAVSRLALRDGDA